MSFSKVSFLPVDNGNMVLLKLNDKDNTTILYDLYIREKATDDSDDTYDVFQYLKENLEVDDQGRYFVDVFMLSHHDDDHIRGFENYFHIGPISDYVKDSKKIIINEVWGTARFLKRASKFNVLDKDAKVFNTEMNRRFELFKSKKTIQGKGDRVRIIGKCPDGGTDGAETIIYKMQEEIHLFNERNLKDKIKVYPLGPLEQQEEENDEDFKKTNRGSTILQIDVVEGKYTHSILLTGDAEVDVCEMLESVYNKSFLEYDILLAPHHCSKYSFYKKINGDESELSQNALNALSHKKDGARIIASCREFGKDTPPHDEAKTAYKKIVGENNFEYTAGYKVNEDVRPIEIELTSDGHKKSVMKSAARGTVSGLAAVGEARGHGVY